MLAILTYFCCIVCKYVHFFLHSNHWRRWAKEKWKKYQYSVNQSFASECDETVLYQRGPTAANFEWPLDTEPNKVKVIKNENKLIQENETSTEQVRVNQGTTATIASVRRWFSSREKNNRKRREQGNWFLNIVLQNLNS